MLGRGAGPTNPFQISLSLLELCFGRNPLSKWREEIFFFFFERGGACGGEWGGRRRGRQSGIRREPELRGAGGRVSAAARGSASSPLPRGRGGAFRVLRSSERAGVGGAGSGGGGGGRLPPQPGQWRRRRRCRGSRERSAQCQPAAEAEELGVREARARPSAAAAPQTLPPPPRAGGAGSRGTGGGGRAGGPGGGWGMARTPGPAPLCPGGGKAQLSLASPPGAGLLLPPPTPPPLLLLLFPLLLFSRLCGRWTSAAAWAEREARPGVPAPRPGPRGRLSRAARRLRGAVGCASGCGGLWLETFRRARGEAREGPGPASATPAARSLLRGRADGQAPAVLLSARIPPCVLRGPLLPR